jgi:hypothetical protein
MRFFGGARLPQYGATNLERRGRGGIAEVKTECVRRV